MSRSNSTARRKVVGVGMAAGAALAAAMISMGTAHAVPTIAPDGTENDPWQNLDTGGYSELFGGTGTAQGVDDASLDVQLADENSGDAAAFSQSVATFEAGDDHPIENLIYAIDPSAYQFQDSPDIVGTFTPGDYLVPDDTLGYIGTELDFFLLNSTGLDYLLSPVVEVLLGSPPF
jgi:hypothetical protein